MSKGDRYREQVLDEAFFGEQIPWTDRAASFRVSLHTAEPQDEHGRLTAQTTPIHADTRRMNGATVNGDGSASNLWRGA